MGTRLKFKPISSAILGAALCFGAVAYAQDTNTATSTPAGKHDAKAGGATADEYPDLVEIDPFGGISIYGQLNQGLAFRLADGGVAGLRLAYNPSKYIGIELWGDFAQANGEFRQPSAIGLATYSFGSRNYAFGLNPIFNLRPRGSKVQPYVTVGIGATQFTPTDTAKGLARQAATNALYRSANLNDNLQPVLNFGGGVKFHLSDHFGLRFDIRDFLSRNPTFGLPNYPDGGIYLPSKQHLNGIQATAGLVFYIGEKKCPPPPPAPAPPAPLQQGTITGAEGQTICQGKPVNLHSTASGAAGHTLQYAWTLNGQTSGSNSADFSFTPNNTGDFTVAVTVTDTTPPPPAPERPKDVPVRCWVQPAAVPPPAPVTATTTVTVADAAPTISTVSASPTTLSCAADKTGTHTATLTASAQASACGGNLSYKWTVSEGSVSNDTSANATFDASTLNFEGGGQNQTKTVTATVTVTTESGKTASQTTQITVNCPPQWVRLPDVVFAKNNARVNNCGKNVLIEQAAPRVANGQYTIVLVGHRDNDEKENVAAVRSRRGRRHAAAEATSLDEQRALNAAGVLSGGGGTCGSVDASRIMVDWVGTDQSSETQPGLCGTSNIKERKGQDVTDADKNRRVEVYLVPNPQTMPPAVKNARPLPADKMKVVGCPK
jgi:outer membrane protein OmpA-like peptidoglycan-associated protein/outer membrane protein W